MNTPADARNAQTRLVAGNLQGCENAVAILFECGTTDEATTLWRTLYDQWRRGMFAIEAIPHSTPGAVPNPEDGT